MKRQLVLPFLVLLACSGKPYISDVWPVDLMIAKASTHRVLGSTGNGKAFVVDQDNHLLVTSADLCQASVQVLGKPAEVVARDADLCLLRVASTTVLGNAMIIAKAGPRVRKLASYTDHDGATREGQRINEREYSASWLEGTAGAPLYDGCGVIGVVVGPRAHYQGVRVIPVGALRVFLKAHHVDYELQPNYPESFDLGGHPWPSSNGVESLRTVNGKTVLPPEILPPPIPRGPEGLCR